MVGLGLGLDRVRLGGVPFPFEDWSAVSECVHT